MKTFEILKNIKMKPGQRAVVRLRFGQDHWQFGHWDGSTFNVIPTALGKKMMYSSREAFYQPMISGEDGFEAWVFDEQVYEAVSSESVPSLLEKPHEINRAEKAGPRPVDWWNWFLAKFV